MSSQIKTIWRVLKPLAVNASENASSQFGLSVRILRNHRTFAEIGIEAEKLIKTWRLRLAGLFRANAVVTFLQVSDVCNGLSILNINYQAGYHETD